MRVLLETEMKAIADIVTCLLQSCEPVDEP